jgi:hypothetical protein
VWETRPSILQYTYLTNLKEIASFEIICWSIQWFQHAESSFCHNIKFRTCIHPLRNQNHEYKHVMSVDFSSKNLQSLISRRKRENDEVEGAESWQVRG